MASDSSDDGGSTGNRTPISRLPVWRLPVDRVGSRRALPGAHHHGRSGTLSGFQITNVFPQCGTGENRTRITTVRAWCLPVGRRPRIAVSVAGVEPTCSWSQARRAAAAPHAVMGTLKGLAPHSAPPNPPASRSLRSASPNPPAMVRGQQSWPALHATLLGVTDET